MKNIPVTALEVTFLTLIFTLSAVRAGDDGKSPKPGPEKAKDQTVISDFTKKALPTDEELKVFEKFALEYKHDTTVTDDAKNKSGLVIDRLSEDIEFWTDADWAARVDTEIKLAVIWHKYNKGCAIMGATMRGNGPRFGGGYLIAYWTKFAAAAPTPQAFTKRVNDFYSFYRTKGVGFTQPFPKGGEHDYVQKAVWAYLEKNSAVFVKPEDKKKFIQSLSAAVPPTVVNDLLKEVQ